MNFDVMFPDKRAEGETRLKQCQHVMLRMLKIFDALCRKHNIEYFLIGGSLLGAVRHKGFIPWDDDLDVGMTRTNYEKFEKLAVPELPNDIFFQTPATDVHYPSCIRVEARLRDKYSTYALSESQKANPWHQGLQVDIFIYDKAYLPNNAFIYAHNRLLQIALWKKGPNNKNHIIRARIQKFLEKLPLPLVYASSFILTKNMIKMGDNYIKPKEIKQLLKMPFEDMQVPVPAGWDACLRRQYGDYMQLPPEEKRSVFHGISEPDPFTPCDHTEILYWQNRPQKELKAV